MFHYKVMTEQEAVSERFQLLQDGDYDAVVAHSEDKMSSSGNPMMALILHVFDASGKKYEIKDFLVFTSGMMWKVIHFSDSANLLKEYMKQELCSKVALNKKIKVKIGKEEGRLIPDDKLGSKPAGSKYPEKNVVVDYVVDENKVDSMNESDEKSEKFVDSDIPF